MDGTGDEVWGEFEGEGVDMEEGEEEMEIGMEEGQRGLMVFRLACKMRRAGVPKEVAARLVLEVVGGWEPPFGMKEAVTKVVRAYARQPSGWVEAEVMREEEKAKLDPGLRAIANQAHSATAALLMAGIGQGEGSGGAVGGGTVGQGLGGERGMEEMSGEELVRLGVESGGGDGELPYLPLLGQKGYIVEGWSHLVAGYPRCGKTELLVRLVREWVDEGRGVDDRRWTTDDGGDVGRVLYVTEESRLLWGRRLAGLGGPGEAGGEWRGLRVAFGLGVPIDVLYRRVMQGAEGIVVIDTLRNLLQLDDETDNSRVAAVLNPWVAGARERGKTLIVAHHMRKGAGEHGEGIAGGHALLGVFDVALELSREGRVSGRRRIRGYARLIEPPELIYEKGADGVMRALGEPSAVQLGEVMERVLEVLEGGEGEWVKTGEVREMLGEPRPSAEQLRLVLLKLAQAGLVERDPAIEQPAERRVVRWRRVDKTALPIGIP